MKFVVLIMRLFFFKCRIKGGLAGHLKRLRNCFMSAGKEGYCPHKGAVAIPQFSHQLKFTDSKACVYLSERLTYSCVFRMILNVLFRCNVLGPIGYIRVHLF